MMQLKAGAGGPDGALLIDAVRRLFAIAEDASEQEVSSTQASAEPNLTHLTPVTPGNPGESK